MASLQRTRQAVADLEAIWTHIAGDDWAAADRILDRLEAATQRIAEFPEIGRARDDLLAGLRMWPVREYLILYRPDADAVRIVRYVHGARSRGGSG